MKNPPLGRRRDRRTGQSPYARHGKQPYHYNFPTNCKYREHVEHTGKHWACSCWSQPQWSTGQCLQLP